MGDVKLALLMGVALGRTVPVALMLGMVAALVPAAVHVRTPRPQGRKLAIPFAPFLALGGLVALFAGGRCSTPTWARWVDRGGRDSSAARRCR